MPPNRERYSRQVRFAGIGEEGQQRLGRSRVLIVGCGALGSVAAETLVRAGVGHTTLVDRDFLEVSNLQRQVLFDEQDVADGLPKAVAAASKLRRINSDVDVEPVVADVTHQNLADLAAAADVIVDGTDNFETRLLINDFAVSATKPWVYGGCLGAEGQVLAIVPGRSACLACLVPEPPAPGDTPTCDTAGILGTAVNVVASLQATEALKLLVGAEGAVSRQLMVVDLWRNRVRSIDVDGLHPPGECPTCDRREFPWLEGRRGSEAAILCGRNSVQLRPSAATKLDLPTLAERLSRVGQVTCNRFLLRLSVDASGFTLFSDGRVIVSGTEDPAEARTLASRYLGL